MPSPREPEPADRWLAVVAYLGCLVGLWLIAPIAVYLLRRRHSRFAAHHAVQAALLHLLLGLLLTVCVVLLAVAGLAAALVIDVTGAASLELIILLGWCSWLAPAAIHLGMIVLAVGRAYRGHIDAASRLGRLTGWLLAHDPGVPAPADQSSSCNACHATAPVENARAAAVVRASVAAPTSGATSTG